MTNLIELGDSVVTCHKDSVVNASLYGTSNDTLDVENIMWLI